MGSFPQPNIVWRGAHPNNFTYGRPGGGRDGRNTFHHVVGSAESAVLVFNQAGRSASTHLVITDRADVAAWQCVSFADTAWGDGNWESNLRTINMEHHGDWRNGYTNAQVLENSARIVAWLRDQNLVSRPIRHRDVKPGTACPSDLPVEAIWNRATQLLDEHYKPAPVVQPQWLQNRSGIAAKTVYAQSEGIFIVNLNDAASPADSRRFVLNQNFEVTGQTTVNGKEFWITRSSMGTNAANGIRKDQVSDTPWAPPVTPVPQPTTPKWSDSVVDTDNREKYVLRATQLINLETGRPALNKEGKEIWYQAGDIIKDVSAHTIVAEVTYELTEYSYAQVKAGKPGVANGIKASDLTIDPKATPEGTPANPTPAPEPADPVDPMPDVPTTPTTPTDPKDNEQDARLDNLEKLIAMIVEFFKGLVGGITKK